MKENSLSPSTSEYIDDLCCEALEFVCTTTKGVSENIIHAAQILMSETENTQLNGVLGYAISHPDIYNENDSQKERPLVKKKNKKPYPEVKYAFFNKMQSSRKLLRERVKAGRVFIRKKYNELPGLSLTDLFADKALELEGGNCLELVLLAVRFLKQIKLERNIDIKVYAGKNFDHAFIVIGNLKGEGFLSNNFNTWPKDTVILDPWLHCRFQLKDMPLYWRDMAYAHRWADVRNWENVSEIMAEKSDCNADHPFFEGLVPQTFKEFLINLSKPQLIEINNVPPIEQITFN